eukprot:111690-Chlamydomonas_euryale.AAC.1
MTSCAGSTRSEGRHAHTCNDLIGFLDTLVTKECSYIIIICSSYHFEFRFLSFESLLERPWPSCASPTYDKLVTQHVTSVLAGCKALHSSLHAKSAQQLQHTMQ